MQQDGPLMEKSTAHIESLFARALELPAGSPRDAFLALECAEDSSLKREVQSLLQAHEQAGDFLREDGTVHLPGYRIEYKAGEGGLGAVYAAHDEKLNRRVALKLLRARTAEPLRQRVLNEARKAAALNDPAIVTIYSVLDDANPPAIVMEWVEGFALDRFAVQLNPQQKARLLREVARGLAVAHAHGLVHRDLKPENIIVGPDMRPRILDFGLAVLPGEMKPPPDGFAGTPLYASPEQLACGTVTSASDVYSFGATMFKVLTGRPPFNGARGLEKDAPTPAPPFLRDVALDVPEDLQAICLACMADDPKDRPTASEVVVELGRFLIGEPVRLRPRLYGDLLRRSVTEYSARASAWQNQNIISGEENDALQGLHRRLLADEDHWIIDARRVTVLQTILSGGTWLAVVATILTVWILRDELGPLGRWLTPLGFTIALLAAGFAALRRRDELAAATFLAGAVLASAPCSLALLAELGFFHSTGSQVTQLFPGVFTNQQVLLASLAALGLSLFGLIRLRMTGFAWTSAVLGAVSYLSCLMLFNWLDKRPEIQALWCLPMVAGEWVALRLEKQGRVRWTLPFHLVAVVALVAGLDIIALNGPTLQMLGVTAERWPFFDHQRLKAFSVALNGLLFIGLMLGTERSASLDLRRASRLLEILAIFHILSALFANALGHRNDSHLRVDAWLYVASAVVLVIMAAMRSRWRMLVGGLAGCGLGSYLLVDLGLVNRKPFIVALGISGLLLALGAFLFVQRHERTPRLKTLSAKPSEKTKTVFHG
jgi:serine/threonine protein kinase